MREFLLWLLGIQRVNDPSSVLYGSLAREEIQGQSPEQILNKLIECQTIEEAEKLALSSGGLRTCRALWTALHMLARIKDTKFITDLTLIEYPYAHLVKLGGKLDEVYTKGRKMKTTDEEGIEDLIRYV
jgi:hypothetical protein